MFMEAGTQHHLPIFMPITRMKLQFLVLIRLNLFLGNFQDANSVW
jgi:hypothetical protein